MTPGSVSDAMQAAQITPAETTTSTGKKPRGAVVVHAGARDSYQLALALSEAGLLESLVTDLFWPRDRIWTDRLLPLLPGGLRELLQRRSARDLPSGKVISYIGAGLRCLLLDRLLHVPFSWRRWSTRRADTTLGRAAGRRARAHSAGLVTYSYYAFDSIREYGRPAMLFQVHPHPATVRRLLQAELEAHPDCSVSLLQEWELALPEDDYQHLVEETHMASLYLVASTFTCNSLVEHGVSASAIKVVPYGVDLRRFHPALTPIPPRIDGRLRLLFVGRINQRKGIKYLLEALRLLDPDQVHLTICGRVVDDLQLFRQFGDQIEIRPSVSEEELVQAYQQADLFVFPSVAEGFGQVLLEAMACGLPILSTTHTAAPDLIEEGREGFIVDPRKPKQLARHIAWAATHRELLAEMGVRSRLRAEDFTWHSFRAKAAAAVAEYLAAYPETPV